MILIEGKDKINPDDFREIDSGETKEYIIKTIITYPHSKLKIEFNRKCNRKLTAKRIFNQEKKSIYIGDLHIELIENIYSYKKYVSGITSTTSSTEIIKKYHRKWDRKHLWLD